MKKSILSILAIATLVFTSCSSDNGDDNKKSSFVLTASDLKGDITDGTVTLKASDEYTLTGALVVRSGASLKIPAGTTIKSSATASAQSLYIAVERGAKIFIEGEANNPVVMTSGKSSPSQSDWGGLVICGDGITNVGTDATSEVASLKYGGANNNDSSGSIEFLKISYTGANNGSDKEFNGVSFFAVGSGTVVENIYTFESGDDGIEFFGGAVAATNLRIENSYDDSLDFADGFVGSVTNVYIKGVTKAGIEGSNNGEDTAALPLTDAKISNVSIIKGEGFGASEQAINLKEGTGKQAYTNLFAEGTASFAKISSDSNTTARIAAGDVKVNGSAFVSANNTIADYVSTETGAGNGATVPTWATKIQ
ncbi:putative secreted protein [Wenyingzhuangia heitensis]|uniref:Secreted protein n=1 Tax=Wenyingzhuangia heitensis TaxID=1487859 RepID=A0ABX0U504_9FLAO|nr:hypothetical protein [Wenyingzhuangia heitensis]NIJ43935.1 putative secreted protein [Wenyingzhuangia heitensis]